MFNVKCFCDLSLYSQPTPPVDSPQCFPLPLSACLFFLQFMSYQHCVCHACVLHLGSRTNGILSQCVLHTLYGCDDNKDLFDMT